MVQFSHFKKVLEKVRKRKLNHTNGEEETDEEEEPMDYDNVPPEEENVEPNAARRRLTTRIEEVSTKASTSVQAPAPKLVELSEDRLKRIRTFLFKLFHDEYTQSVDRQKLNAGLAQETEFNFTPDEIESALNIMQDENQIFLSGDLIILV